jgi:hypothetical protein
MVARTRFFLDAATAKDHVSGARRSGRGRRLITGNHEHHAKRQSRQFARYVADDGSCGLSISKLTGAAVVGGPRR